MGIIEGGQVRVRSFEAGSPALGVNTAILADTALNSTNPTVVSVFAGQPDVARNLTVKGNDSNVTGNVTITGTNILGQTITETIALNGSTAVSGNKAFETVTSISLPKYAVANTERIRVGTGAKLGLPVCLTRNTVLFAFLAGAREGTAPTVAIDADEVEKNTATLNSALNGSAVIVDLYETH